MKKAIFILFAAILSVSAYAQRGDLTVGLKGGYVNSTKYYKDILYGTDIAYHLSDYLELAFTGLINPNVKWSDSKLAVYSGSLDFRLYLIHQREWGMGPALGGQYLVVDNKTNKYGPDKSLGFNLGWHIRASLTDNLKINGGWRYTNAKVKSNDEHYSDFDMSHHFFYLGLAYTFELF
jgi:opacity protein-like surface antigen